MTKELITPIPSLTPNENQIAQMERKFGMFLHFGVNTFGNIEWSDGGIDARSYQPTAINADQWVKTAYDAGMNYVVLITKHHDGFCLWDTKHTDYSVNYSGNTTDVVAAVAKACETYGLKLGLYYSLWDRKEPCYRDSFSDKYVKYMLDQLTELLDGRYGEIVELWLDGSWDRSRTQWRFDLVYDLVKRLQPDCQIGINHTMGVDFDKAGGPNPRYQPQNIQELDPVRMFPSDFRLWDPHPCRADDPKLFTYGGETYYMPFEMTICSREGFSWFYSNIYEEKPLLNTEETVNNIKICFTSNNPVIINMPPDISGNLVAGDVEHLMKIAGILGINRI